MLKADFYNSVSVNLKATNKDIKTNKSETRNGIELLVSVPNKPLATFSDKKVIVRCNRNIVTIITYDTRTRDWKTLYSNTIDWNKGFKPNMVLLTVKTVLNQLKGDLG